MIPQPDLIINYGWALIIIVIIVVGFTAMAILINRIEHLMQMGASRGE